MAKRYGVTGPSNETSDELAASFRAEIDAQGWTFVALVDPGYTIFEVQDDGTTSDEVRAALPDGTVIGVPINYPG